MGLSAVTLHITHCMQPQGAQAHACMRTSAWATHLPLPPRASVSGQAAADAYMLQYACSATDVNLNQCIHLSVLPYCHCNVLHARVHGHCHVLTCSGFPTALATAWLSALSKSLVATRSTGTAGGGADETQAIRRACIGADVHQTQWCVLVCACVRAGTQGYVYGSWLEQAMAAACTAGRWDGPTVALEGSG